MKMTWASFTETLRAFEDDTYTKVSWIYNVQEGIYVFLVKVLYAVTVVNPFVLLERERRETKLAAKKFTKKCLSKFSSI